MDLKEYKDEYMTTDSKESSGNIDAQNSFQSENAGNLMGNEIVSIGSPSKTQISEHDLETNSPIKENVHEEIQSTSSTR